MIIYYYLQFLIHVFGVQFLILGALCVILVFILSFLEKISLREFCDKCCTQSNIGNCRNAGNIYCTVIIFLL